MLIAVGLAATASSATAQATFTGLGDLAGGDTFSLASAVSADGTVVAGYSSSTASGSGRFDAFRWTSGGGLVSIGDLSGGVYNSLADAISDDGSVIAGDSSSSNTSGTNREGFTWTSGGGMVGIGVQNGASPVNGISADGTTLVGFATFSGVSEGYYWTSGGGISSIGRLTGDLLSNATSTSSDGSIVYGYAPTSSGTEPRKWTSGGGLVNMFSSDDGLIRATNDAGAICTGGYGSGTSREMLLYVAADTPPESGLPNPSGTDTGMGWALSDDGTVVVGSAETVSTSDQVATIWIDGLGSFVLQDWLEDNFGLDLSAWTLEVARGISEDGLTIVGYGTKSSNTEAWHVTLPWLHCPADWNKDGQLTMQDVTDFNTDYSGGNADYNGDGSTNSLDYVAFLNDYNSGC